MKAPPDRQKCLILLMVLWVVLLLASQGLKAQSPDKRRPITVDDLFKIKRVGSPEISPEGKWVAYTVTNTELKEDKSETRIWMVPVTGGKPLPMTGKGSSASSLQWSPDGKYLSFLASRNEGKSQVWALDRRGGEAQQLTDVPQGVSGYKWSPDGKRLLLLLRDPKPEDLEKDEAKKKSKKPEPWVIDRLQFKRDRSGYLDKRHTHLYVFELGSKEPTQITSGDFDESQPAWSPDGKKLAFVSNRTDNPDGNSNTNIWVVAADNTDKGQTLHQVTQNPGSDSSPAWSPDGRSLTYVTVIEPDIIWYATNHLAIIPVQSGQSRILTLSLDRNVSSPRFSPDGTSIYFLLEDSAERHLAKISMDGSNLTRPVSGQRSVRSFMLSKDGKASLLISEPHLPGEVFVLDAGELKKITAVNDSFLDGLKLAEVKNIHFKSKDGTEIEGFVHLPLGFDPSLRYPTLLRIHGGPVSQYDFSFSFEPQLFAANGYLVIRVNPRGSSGYGQEFSLALWQKWGVKDFEDVMAGVDYVISQGYADPDRLGVGGWSYGGILTNYVITQTDRFKGAITGASEVLYVANYGHDHYQYQW